MACSNSTARLSDLAAAIGATYAFLHRPAVRDRSLAAKRQLASEGFFLPSIRTACCHRLGALSVRWMHPAQQHGRFLPSNSAPCVRTMRRCRVAGCLASSTQQMNSFRPRGVSASHKVNMFGSDRTAA
jgi:hypothetical protein